MNAGTNKPPLERLLTIEEAAEILGVSVKTLRRRIYDCEIAVIRDGRILRVAPDDIRRFISRNRVG